MSAATSHTSIHSKSLGGKSLPGSGALVVLEVCTVCIALNWGACLD